MDAAFLEQVKKILWHALGSGLTYLVRRGRVEVSTCYGLESLPGDWQVFAGGKAD